MVDLDAYLNNRTPETLPADATSPAFDEAQAKSPWRPFHYATTDQRNASQHFADGASLLFADAIEQNPIRVAADAVVAALRRTQATATPSFEDLRAAQRAFLNLNAALRRPDLAWVGSADMRLPTELAAVTLQPIGKSAYLPASLQTVVQQSAADCFARMTAALDAASTPLSGPLLDASSGRLQLTDKAQEAQLSIENLLNLSFVAPRSSGASLRSNGGGSLDWNKPALQEAAKLPEGLRRYLEENLQQAPLPLQASLGRIARDKLSAAMESAIADAEVTGPRLPAAPSLQKDLQPAIQRFNTAAPALRGRSGEHAEQRAE